MQTAFTSSAQSLIADTAVDNSAESTTDSGNNLPQATPYACENTSDKIFLLSEKEATSSDYGFAEYDVEGVGNSRIRMPTDYAKANYAYQDSTAGYGGEWWLRSPSGCIVGYISGGGGTNNASSVNCTDLGVVPALCLK